MIFAQEVAQQAPEWVQVAREFGFPIVALIFVCIAIAAAMRWGAKQLVSAARWFGNEFIIPMRKQVEDFFQGYTRWMSSMQSYLTDFRESYERHDEWERGQAVERATKITALQTKVEELEKRLEEK